MTNDPTMNIESFRSSDVAVISKGVVEDVTSAESLIVDNECSPEMYDAMLQLFGLGVYSNARADEVSIGGGAQPLVCFRLTGSCKAQRYTDAQLVARLARLQAEHEGMIDAPGIDPKGPTIILDVIEGVAEHCEISELLMNATEAAG